MSQLVEFALADGQTILVEAESRPTTTTTRRWGSGEDVVDNAGQTLEQVLGKVGPAIKGIVHELRSAVDWPAEVEVEFSVKVTADAGVIIARSGGEANFRVALKWTRDTQG